MGGVLAGADGGFDPAACTGSSGRLNQAASMGSVSMMFEMRIGAMLRSLRNQDIRWRRRESTARRSSIEAAGRPSGVARHLPRGRGIGLRVGGRRDVLIDHGVANWPSPKSPGWVASTRRTHSPGCAGDGDLADEGLCRGSCRVETARSCFNARCGAVGFRRARAPE